MSCKKRYCDVTRLCRDFLNDVSNDVENGVPFYVSLVKREESFANAISDMLGICLVDVLNVLTVYLKNPKTVKRMAKVISHSFILLSLNSASSERFIHMP